MNRFPAIVIGLIAVTTLALAQQKKLPGVNIPELAGLYSAEIEGKLGKATHKEKVRDLAAWSPGEYRQYDIKGNTRALLVRFYKDRAVSFVLTLPKRTESAEEALSMAGFDVNGTPPSVETRGTLVWQNITVNGIKFEYVDVTKGDVLFSPGKYTELRARVSQ
jgi:hypothetical protein